MSDNHIDSEEALKALLVKQAKVAADEADSGKTEAARLRAAKDWISHYVYIKKFRQELIDGGMEPEEFTQDAATRALLEKWNDSAEVRSTDAI